MSKRKITLKTPDSDRPLEEGVVVTFPKLKPELEVIPAGAIA